MARYLARLADPRDGREWWLEWSTIVDAPVSWGATLLDSLPNGRTLRPPHPDEDLLCGNRAGPNETELTLVEIIDRYCLRVETAK